MFGDHYFGPRYFGNRYFGGGGAVIPPPEYSIELTADDASVSVVQGSTVDVLCTLTRGFDYEGTVTLSVTGLPAGVSASYPDGQTFTGAATTRRVRLSAAVDATPVTDDAYVISADGDDVDPSEVAGTVTVTEYTPPAFGPASLRSYVWFFLRRRGRR